MRIAELAKRVGVATSAVRWYEAHGVLPSAVRTDNGYREYSNHDVSRLQLVVGLRRLGLAPEDAGRIARLCLERGSIDLDLVPVLEHQRASIAAQRAELDRLESELIDLELTIAAAGRPRRKEHFMPNVPIRVLFVCTHNSARSQIAEALLGNIGGSDFEVHSAGTEAGTVNPYTVRVLAEVGIDWSQAKSKPVQPYLDQQFDYVITVCDRAREACPVFPGAVNSMHWGLDDPAEVEGTDEEKMAAFRRTVMEVTLRIRPFVEVALRAAGRDRHPSIAG